MKTSQQPTNRILVRAHTDSEWDFCDFAIIDCGKEWADRTAKRLDAARTLYDDTDFFSCCYFDGGVSFCVSREEDLDELLPDGNVWTFVELEDGEQERFAVPESRLECYRQVLYKSDYGRYTALGKHTGEEFYTEDLPLGEITEAIPNRPSETTQTPKS